MFPHFMGAIIYEGEGGAYTTKKVQVCNVIDGQQRLTTLQIFFAAIRDVARSKGFEDIAEDTRQYLFNPNEKLMTEPEIEIYKVWPTRFDRDVFKDIISANSLNEITNRSIFLTFWVPFRQFRTCQAEISIHILF